MRGPDNSTASIDIAPCCTRLHVSQAMMKVVSKIKLSRNDDFSACVDKPPLFVKLYCGKPLGKGTHLRKLRGNGCLSRLVDKSPPLPCLDLGQSFGKSMGQFVRGGYFHRTLSIDKSPFAVELHRCESLLKRMCTLEGGRDDCLSAFVQKAV